jgi:hypothetical protein
MRDTDLEDWARSVVKRIRSGFRIEDDRVEVKREWPEPQEAARKVAGHCNAAGAEYVLWVIGIDEKKGTLHSSKVEPANWFAGFRSCFEGVSPEYKLVHVPLDEGQVTAISFATEHAPFIVKHKGGILEVPWREATAIRSARREELLRLLSKITVRPEVDLLSGSLLVEWRETDGKPSPQWTLGLDVYLKPASRSPAVIPFHDCTGTLTVEGIGEVVDGRVSAWRNEGLASRAVEPTASNVRVTHSDIVIEGPGYVGLVAYWSTGGVVPPNVRPKVRLVLPVVGARRPLTMELFFSPQPTDLSRRGAQALDWSVDVSSSRVGEPGTVDGG